MNIILSASTLPDVYQGNKRYPGGTFTCPGKNRGLKLEIRRPFFAEPDKNIGIIDKFRLSLVGGGFTGNDN